MSDFETIINKLHQNIGQSDPDAQQRMAPFKLGDRSQALQEDPNPRLSAVMILIYSKNNDAHLALIERPVYDGVHSGQIAFPGGKKDPSDKNLQITALRELEEEIGITSENIKVLGQISKVYIPPSQFLVTPFVGILTGEPNFKKDDFEVKSIIELPLKMLFDHSIIKTGTVPVGNRNMKMKAPYFDVYGHKVWGATAIMLSEFKAILK
jgi:8-oxo-dGTP pyrophosphatase MutT (NUDIX family)